MCKKCQEKEKFKVGPMTGQIEVSSNEALMVFEYEGYSLDSSFDTHEAWVDILFCPFCGEKFSNVMLDSPASK